MPDPEFPENKVLEPSLREDDSLEHRLGGDKAINQTISDPIREHAHSERSQAQLKDWLDRVGNFDNRYQAQEVIGAGAMGIVIKAKDVFLESDVAIKVLLFAEANEAERTARFIREMRVLAALDHPNIVKIRASGITSKGKPFFVMDFLRGQSLDALIKEQGHLKASQLKEIVPSVLDGLMYLHENKIIHRDLKPSNIVCVENSDGGLTLKLIDFGIAITQDVDSVRLTKTNVSVGSPEYMSPEQCRCDPLDERSDIYSFGCLLFACLSGRAPFSADTPLEVMYKHMHEAVVPLESGTPEMTNLVLSCLEKDPTRRPQSMQELKSAFLRISADIDTSRMRVPSSKKQSSKYGLLLFAIMGLLAIIPLSIFVMGRIAQNAQKHEYQILSKDERMVRSKMSESSLNLATTYLKRLNDRSLPLQSRVDYAEKIVDRLDNASTNDPRNKGLVQAYRSFESALKEVNSDLERSNLDKQEKTTGKQSVAAARIRVLGYIARLSYDDFEQSISALRELRILSRKEFGVGCKQEFDSLHSIARLYLGNGKFKEALKFIDELYAMGPVFDASPVFIASRAELSGMKNVLGINTDKGRAGQRIRELFDEVTVATRRQSVKDPAEIAVYIKFIEGLQQFGRPDGAKTVLEECRSRMKTFPPSRVMDDYRKRLLVLEDINKKALAKTPADARLNWK